VSAGLTSEPGPPRKIARTSPVLGERSGDSMSAMDVVGLPHAVTPGASDHVMSVIGLTVQAPSGDNIVEELTLNLLRGETLGLVGESGSGKTTAVLALLGYAQSGARIVAGQIRVDGESLDYHSEAAMRKLRGRAIAYVPQDPGSALVPTLRIGSAVSDMMTAHRDVESAEAAPTIAAVLERCGLRPDLDFQRRYPHQLSGGQQQRMCLAVALVCAPPVVVLDEPTTGLDVVTQSAILAELARMKSDEGISMVYVSHDLAVVAGMADRIAVMYAGRIVEQGPTRELLTRPSHPYTRGLLAAIPDHVRPHALEPMPGVAAGVGERSAGCSFAPRCPLRIEECSTRVPPPCQVGPQHEARCLRASEVAAPDLPSIRRPRATNNAGTPALSANGLWAGYRDRTGWTVAAADIDLAIWDGECVALVGESGSGKTTIARTIAGLHGQARGEIRLRGELLAPLARKRSRLQRSRIQIIQQNPMESLNPRHRVGDAVARPARMLRGLSSAESTNEVSRLFELVRLPSQLARRYPAELSGGERQRVSIARALAAEPEVIVCDEITSALDVSVQAAILTLLGQLREQLGLALLFITHNFGVVATVANRVLVLHDGKIIEDGSTEGVLRSPQDVYTRSLLDAAPSLSRTLSSATHTKAAIAPLAAVSDEPSTRR
jgi:peptide/nickel transport system ATP-binding protein